MINKTELEIGDIVYKIKNGKKFSYYACEIVEKHLNISGKLHYKYIILGRNKTPATKFKLGTFGILAYKTSFFDSLIELYQAIISKNKPERISIKVKNEYADWQKHKIEFFI